MSKVMITLSLVIDTDEEPGDAVSNLAESLSGYHVAPDVTVDPGTVEVEDWDVLS